MWGSRLLKPIVTQTARYLQPKISHSSSMWAGMDIKALQNRTLWLPCLSGLTIFNLRQMLEKALEEGELGSVGTGVNYLVQGTVLEGTMVCSVIKSQFQDIQSQAAYQWAEYNQEDKSHQITDDSHNIHLKASHLFYHSYQSLNHCSYLWQLHHMNHNLAVVFQVGIIAVNFSTYFFIAYSLDIFPNFFQASHFIFYTTFNRLGAFVLFSPSVACLNSPQNSSLLSLESYGCPGLAVLVCQYGWKANFLCN